MNSIFLRSIHVLVLGCFLTSCCTMMRAQEKKIEVVSEPTGAHITIDGYDCGTTPQAFMLSTKHSHWVTVEKEGYLPEQYYLQNQTSPIVASYAAAPLAGAAIGAGIAALAFGTDAWAGAMIAVAGVGGLAVGGAVGLFGLGVDLYSNSAKKLNAEIVQAELQPAY